MAKMPAPEDENSRSNLLMALNKYQTILRIELNNGICYSRHHLMVPGNFYPRVVDSFKNGSTRLITLSRSLNNFEIKTPTSFKNSNCYATLPNKSL